MDSQARLAWSGRLLTAGIGLSAFTSGALASMSLITIPAILTNTSNGPLLTSWRQSLVKGVQVAPTFAVAATVAHAINTYLNRSIASDRARYLGAAAVSTIAIVPFTIFILAPTNQELFKRERAAQGTTTAVESSTADLVRKWGRLNLYRSFLPALGALLASFALHF